MITTLIIRRDAFKKISLSAIKGQEICGVMSGCIRNDTAYVTCIDLVDNVAGDTESVFEMEGSQLLSILKETTFFNKEAFRDFCGIFHTHPRAYLPIPSSADFKGSVTGGYDAPYLIYSPERGLMNAYYWDSALQVYIPINVRII